MQRSWQDFGSSSGARVTCRTERFPGFTTIEAGIWPDTTYLQDLLATRGIGGTLKHMARSAVKFFMFWRGLHWWKGHFHRYLWLFRPYKVTAVLLRKA